MEFTLSSGATLNVTMSSFDDADALQTALLNSVKGMKLNEDVLATDISDMLEPILNAATSKDVKAALFKCFERATYDKQKMSKALLDDPGIGERVREDYYEICVKVIEVNCKPFFKKTFSLFGTALKTKPAIPGQKSA